MKLQEQLSVLDLQPGQQQQQQQSVEERETEKEQVGHRGYAGLLRCTDASCIVVVAKPGEVSADSMKCSPLTLSWSS